jgi:hypothetical protein
MSEFAKENILDLVLLAFSRQVEVIPDRPAIEAMTDNFLKAFGHLAESREWIISQSLAILVTSIGKAQELVDPNDYREWLEKHDRSAWRSWPWLKIYLKEKLRRPSAVIGELDRSSDRVLELIGDPAREGLWDRRGMVVGHVQSGKTQHYTAVAAKAIDAGYKLVVILSGIHENLRQQTQERIEECITGKNSRDQFQPFGIRTFALQFKSTNNPDQLPPDISSLTSVAGDFGAAVNKTIDVALGEVPVVLVIKKNVAILKNLLKKIRGGKVPYTTLKCPTLVIDDEADHSSVNTAKIDPDTDPTRINELIRKILWACDKVAFVGYTATPYANIFMEDAWVQKREGRNLDEPGSDLFPRAFIIGLEAPSNYIGPDVVFGHEGDESLGLPPRAPLPMHQEVGDADSWLPAKHKSSHQVGGNIPSSLSEALKVFVLSIAARTAIGQDTSHCSMLIHVTRFNDVQAQVMAQVKAYLDGLYSELESGVGRDALWDDLRKIWDRIFTVPFTLFCDHPSQKLDPPVLPDWVEVEANVNSSLGRLKFASVNSLSKDNLDFAGNGKEGLVVVAVGGDRLSRGLTLEGLTVSYFLRGARAYDTLMQMGRWFGYRPSYTHLCRVYAPSAITRNFRTITLATEELRREFSRMCYLKRTPVDYGLQVREPRADLLVTALNKMRRGETVRIHFAESLVSSLDIPEKGLMGNLDAFKQLVETMERTKGAPSPDGRGNHKWEEIDWDMIAPFLAAYTANSHVCLANDQGRSLLYTYIDSVQKHGDLNKWTVVVVGKAKGTPVMDGNPFTLIGRQRLMKIPEAPTQPIFPNRITFQGVAMGADEKLDLTQTQIDEAERLKAQNHYRSLAAAFRAQRNSSCGLLLLYPISPTNPEGSTAEAWDGPTVIGIAVSLPSSKHDKGCDYVCTPQKMREIFGTLADDLKRDEEEDQNLTS